MEIIPKHFIYLLLYSKCSEGQLTPSEDMNLQALNIPCCRGVSVYLCVVPLCSRKDLRLFTHVQAKTKEKCLQWRASLFPSFSPSSLALHFFTFTFSSPKHSFHGKILPSPARNLTPMTAGCHFDFPWS